MDEWLHMAEIRHRRSDALQLATKVVNQAIKRNTHQFPGDFAF